MMMRVICFALLLACVSAGSVRLRTKETELGHDSSPYAGCDVFLTQMIQLTRDYETQPQDAQIKSCDTLEAHTEQCKALVSRYGLAPMHHLAAFRPDVMCSFFRGEQINDASAEERAQADGGKSDDILMSATDADDDSDSDDDEDSDDDSDSDSDSSDDSEDSEEHSLKHAPASEISALRQIEDSGENDDDDDDSAEEDSSKSNDEARGDHEDNEDDDEDHDLATHEAALDISRGDRVKKADKQWGANAGLDGDDDDDKKKGKGKGKGKGKKSAAQQMKQMEKVVRESVKMLPLQHHLLRMKMMEETANTAALLHNVAMQGYLSDPNCADKDDISCQTQGLMDGINYLSGTTMGPMGGLFGPGGSMDEQ